MSPEERPVDGTKADFLRASEQVVPFAQIPIGVLTLEQHLR